MRLRNWGVSVLEVAGAITQHVGCNDKKADFGRHQTHQWAPTSKSSRIRRIVERYLLAMGLVLMATYGIALVHRSVGSELAISGIEAGQAAPSNSVLESAVDFSLWSEKRIKAYSDSFSLMKGQTMAVLTLARLRIKAPVFVGTDELALNRGLGWIPGTAKPGGPGNVGIAGHRDGFFRALKDVAAGDVVELKTPQERFIYRVDEIEVVNPEDVRVLRSRSTAALTLVTCFPFYFVGDAPLRFIVHAKLEGQVATNSVRNSGPPRI